MRITNAIPKRALQVTGVIAATAAVSAGVAIAATPEHAAKPSPAVVAAAAAIAADRTAADGTANSRSGFDRLIALPALPTPAPAAPPAAPAPAPAPPKPTDPRDLARSLMPEYGMSTAQFSCLDYIWTQESGWNIHARNSSSGAYGIPQSLPGSKMASAGPDWQNNAETQIRWGLGYIKDRYGSACGAAGFKRANGYY